MSTEAIGGGKRGERNQPVKEKRSLIQKRMRIKGQEEGDKEDGKGEKGRIPSLGTSP